MNFKTAGNDHDTMQIAPMMDIIFLLLVFFLATYALTQDERSLHLQLPITRAGIQEVRTLREIVVNLNAEGVIEVNRFQLSLPDLTNRLKKLQEFTRDCGVTIRADSKTSWEQVMQIMDACREAGILHISFNGLNPEESAAQ